jgi:RimJ/RimL family protein N-acetyltransferase
MAADPGIRVRPAAEADVDAVRDLFARAYGPDYPFRQFYDGQWLRKAVFDDDTLFLVGERAGAIVGTASAVFTSGGLSDLIGEFGRLVVHPDAHGRGFGMHLFEAVLEACADRVQFGFAEARTAHDATQKICERAGFAAVGFQPLKYALEARESTVFYARLFGQGRTLRRNNPRVIPEAAPLAMFALKAAGLPADVIVSDQETGYPAADDVAVEALSETGWSPLLRIERGRVRGREVFGNLSLSHGFFKFRTDLSRYLVARRDGSIVGGLGFTYDPIDAKVRLFELIGFDEGVKGRLLAEVDRLACERLGAVYLEADVSAYEPAMQRTLERLGFMAVAYGPSMVFHDVERLDVVRMAKLAEPYFRESLPLTAAAGAVRDIVERAMRDRRQGREVAEAARGTGLFRGLDEGDVYHLARAGRVARVPAGEVLIRQGEKADRLFILVAGDLRVRIGGREAACVAPGEAFGEIALLDAGPRTADVVAAGDATVVEFLIADLARLMAERPRLGRTVMQNLGAVLAARLRALDALEWHRPPADQGA